ncbi:efflux RND transporter periplasmic adaptor subunit [Geobacter sulfurreducens]|jgi:HlyD family secretion protein|uniref:Efflux pump, RND family, membrane fusion protein n=1 Tax=Geobacter sulfurreducens (strain ATCC 51573 / DSM 12127 / PCA) TaxID=243231 RepID=Q74FV6_GEOSL|nr:efflux RND transporter periplasmic adaptor subunit [Geobacter sulfurreducens]AAR33828.1 efflux pump, RND family, membrane fusion protein [Geobacter sulfurreducens PCA]ADI83346.1 efflux pump, RND family, membrane fusion protein [Geobacter sulfurreducens KN400]AJY70248.1 RND transporter [Geobacter sulfurreducens]QVW35751.1 efflux RND transporter periplasmic adaptor subunit [Geobacter sulfurreducens]UAC04573.1 efflux RND transporter periplasmic adaptor subunit [Geobacter sulfurreducens]
MKKAAIIAAVVIVAVAGIYFAFGKREPERTYKTAKVERGDVVATVSATGNLSAVTTVQVGTQVSGTIYRLLVDYNTPVKKGQVIAEIDPALFRADVEQARGNLLSAQANLLKARATAADAKRTMERNRQLVKEGVVSQSDFDTAETGAQEAAAAVKAAEASVVQTRGALSRAETNLKNATIRSPVDGVVISRAVDVGQTVAASFQTPTLFTIAQDLTRMQIETSVDEADISRVRMGQQVTFTVDAYPDEKFNARVAQIRNAPVITQNVVTYVVVITVDNPDLKLKPGMTANVAIEVGKKEKVLKVPMAALRFKPRADGDEGERRAPSGPAKAKREAGQQVFILSPEKKPVPVKVQTGLGNDSHVEIVSGALKEGDEVIVQETTPRDKQKSGGSGRSPMGMRF